MIIAVNGCHLAHFLPYQNHAGHSGYYRLKNQPGTLWVKSFNESSGLNESAF